MIVSTGFANNTIRAIYKDKVIASQPFTVSGTCSSVISGKVHDKDEKALYDASVILKSNGSQVGVAMTNPDGTFSAGEHPCGSYSLQANWQGHMSEERFIDTANGASVTLKVDYPVVSSDKTPVLLVPGFLGSSKKGSHMLGYTTCRYQKVLIEASSNCMAGKR